MENEISKLNIHGNILNLKDNAARTNIENVESKLNVDSLKDGQAIAWDNINGKFISIELSDKLTDSDFEDIFNK